MIYSIIWSFFIEFIGISSISIEFWSLFLLFSWWAYLNL